MVCTDSNRFQRFDFAISVSMGQQTHIRLRDAVHIVQGIVVEKEHEVSTYVTLPIMGWRVIWVHVTMKE